MGTQNIYIKLKAAIGNDFGVCGLMGNLKAESNMRANNLQNTYSKKFGMTDEQYTEAVDNGKYTNFVKDSAGYGLAQWTYWSRKDKLLKYAKAYGTSIGDENMQIEFMLGELVASYPTVLNALKNAKSVREASDVVLTKYERPADQSESVKIKRTSYGEEFYKQFVKNAEGKEGADMKTRSTVVNLANSWLGKNEADGSFKSIIDIYNTLPSSKLPRGTRMLYSWEWCACTWSAIAVKLDYLDIMPIEISCYYIIERAKKMGIWIENENRVPKLAEAVLYDWGDKASNYKTTDNKGGADHIGVVVEVNEDAGYFVVVEGNYSQAVKKRTLSINGRYIRGFISPKYDDDGVVQKPAETGNKSIETLAREVIAGSWGTGSARKQKLEAAGYNYKKVQDRVNEILNGKASNPVAVTPTANKSVTATDYATKYDKTIAGTYKTATALHMRHGAGTNKKSMVVIPKNVEVKCYGYYSIFNGAKWYYIQVKLDGVKYTGFSHSGYLKK